MHPLNPICTPLDAKGGAFVLKLGLVFKRKARLKGWAFLLLEEDLKIKYDADERRPLRLDTADSLFLWQQKYKQIPPFPPKKNSS